nr:EOG090X069C [Eurycercus lamellatus]
MVYVAHYKYFNLLKNDEFAIFNQVKYLQMIYRIKKTLYYGALPEKAEDFNSSHSLTSVVVERFGQNDTLFLEKLCFDYAADVSRETCLSPCSLVLALIYLERLVQKNPNYVSSVPSSKLFLISVMVASKFLNDDGEEDEVINCDWASSAKIDLQELNQLERQFLQAIDWALFVDEEDFSSTLNRIESRVAQREGLRRGWLTYTDLDVLSRAKLLADTWELIHSLVINVSMACMTAYLASLVTLLGSALVVSSMPWNAPSIPSPISSNTLDSPLNTSTSSGSSSLLPDATSRLSEDEFSLPDVNFGLQESFINFAGMPDSVLSGLGMVVIDPLFPHLSNPPDTLPSDPVQENSSSFQLVHLFPDEVILPRCTLVDSVSRFISTSLPLCVTA